MRRQRDRGRPRAFNREAALAAATRLFWSKGYGATSISDLTAAMGIGSPSLYAAFGSKESLFTEAVRYYMEHYDALVWERFRKADTAREAVNCFLQDSATALSGHAADIPRGCMVTLSAVGSEGYPELGKLVHSARASISDRIRTRLLSAIDEGELSSSIEVHPLVCFVQSVQNGMSVLARDGADHSELEAVAYVAMLAWDTYVLSM